MKNPVLLVPIEPTIPLKYQNLSLILELNERWITSGFIIQATSNVLEHQKKNPIWIINNMTNQP